MVRYLLIFVFMTTPLYALQEEDVTGVWYTPNQGSQIEIYPCEEAYCGKIIWLKEPRYPQGDKMGMGGETIIDRHNPDPLLKNRSLVGLELMENFIYQGDLTWKKGWIYNPNNGKKYRCRMKLVSKDRLEVRGYLMVPVLGKTVVWTR